MPCVFTSEIFHGVGRKGGGANQMIICNLFKDWAIY